MIVPRSLFSRRLALAFSAVILFVLASSAPAGAVVTEVATGLANKVVGLQPRNTTQIFEGTPTAASFENSAGNPVLHSTNTYVIYWDPTDSYHGDWQHLINGFLHGVGAKSGSAGNVFSVDAQYTDKSNLPATYRSTFRGAYTDTTGYPPPECTDPEPLLPGDAITCLTDRQIQGELQSFISQHSLHTGMGTIFYLLTPPGVTTCIDKGASASHCSDKPSSAQSFCSYHAAISPTNPEQGDANTILYAVIPWSAGGLGNYHLRLADQTPAYDCQDGGFDPSSTPIEQKEKAKEKSTKEEEEFGKKTTEEKNKQLAAEALEGPHQEEPNQLSGTGPEGSYGTGLADVIINQIAVEQQNTVTDPLLNAWQDSAHNESTDECRNFFAPVLGGSVTANEHTKAGTLFNQSLDGGNYYLNMAFNLAALQLPFPGVACMGGIDLAPSFTAPNPVNAGDIVGFDGMESDITLNSAINFTSGGGTTPTYPKFTWDFGDGTPKVSGYAPGAATVNSPGASPCAAPWLSPCAASTFHAYQYGGTYQVTLSVTDVGGNTGEITKPVTVVGPPPPSSEPGKEGTPGASPPASPPPATGSTAAAGTGATTPGTTATAGAPSPVASAAVASTSLAKVLRNGLVIRYSVNEQVTGRFEVLLDAGTARRLGIHGPRAAGLPAGSPASIVVGKAILVTTKGGRNTVKILFGKHTAARLHKMQRVSLALRMIVRNASSQGSKSTTVLSKITLHR
ncbi:MAG TPA: hypothetical protein VGG98_09815 [Solirubrobacteraceae bacterium]